MSIFSTRFGVTIVGLIMLSFGPGMIGGPNSGFGWALAIIGGVMVLTVISTFFKTKAEKERIAELTRQKLRQRR